VKTFPERRVSLDDEKLIKYLKSSASGSCRNFLKNSSTLRDGTCFPTLAHICGKKSSNLREHFVTDRPIFVGKKFPNFALRLFLLNRPKAADCMRGRISCRQPLRPIHA